MSKKIATPESLLPDGLDGKEFGGVYIRKGSIAACFQNALILDDPMATQEEKEQALQQLKELAPIIDHAFSMSQVVTWKNPVIHSLCEAAKK